MQGVFYRATAKKVADKLNLTGWIKNRKDYSVEALATGEEDRLQEFITWCKSGPEKSKVKDVIVTNQQEMVFEEFSVIR